MNNIEDVMRAAREKMDNNPPLCFHCRNRMAINVVLIVTDDVARGAPLDGSRLLAVGMCSVCEMYASPADLRGAAERLIEGL
jgi:hypothetical protein